MIDYTFFTDVEKRHDYVKYSDTDSLFLNIPQIQTNSIEDLIKAADDVSKFINKNITHVMNNYLLPKMGVDTSYNMTDFKNEIVIGILFLLDVKKNYAYTMIAKEGNIVDPPKPSYTGIPIVRNDSSKFTQTFLKYMIDEVILSGKFKTPQEMLSEINRFAHTMKQKLDDDILNFRFKDIGIPSKWGGRDYADDTSAIIGMKLYNTIMNDPVFGPLTSGRRVLIKITNPTSFLTNIAPFRDQHPNYISSKLSIDKLTNICIPYKYDPKLLEQKFEHFSIKIDNKEMWSTLFSKTCQRIVAVIKSLTGF